MQALKVTEDELIAQLQDEHTREKAFRVLVLQYRERLYWHVRSIVQTHENADDVVQNVFIKIYRNIDKFKGDSKLYTWLYRIATNESLTFLKQQKRNASQRADDNELLELEQRPADANIDGNALEILLEKAIETLPEKQKIVFRLRYFEEIPYQDLAEILETSVGALKASYHHAAKKIEKIITES